MVRRLMKTLKAHVEERMEGMVPRGVSDPRRKKPKYRLEAVWRTAVVLHCLMQRSARAGTEYARERAGRLVCGIGRTALSDVLSRLDPAQAREVLRRQIHAEHRRKALQPDGLPVGVVAIDGRTNWVGPEKVNAWCQRSHLNDEAQTPYWKYRVVRAVLVSAAARVCIDEAPIPAETNDMGVFASFFKAVLKAYRRTDLFEVVTADAGFCSEANARLVDKNHRAYLFGLKGNQPELHAEAERVLQGQAATTAPEAVSGWEWEKGKKVQRRLWRAREMAGWLDWTHLRQVWLVRKVCLDRDGREVVLEDRYFATNLPVNRLTSEQALELVRRHWAVENDCFWTLDTQWEEDAGLWTRKGNGLLICGLLRMIAYNIVALLRAVHCKSDGARQRTWKAIAQLFNDFVVAVAFDRELLPSFV